jgi:hypothetical protein
MWVTLPVFHNSSPTISAAETVWNTCQHTHSSFVKALGILSTPPTRTQHGHTATRQGSVKAETRGHACIMPVTSSSLANLCPHKASFSGPNM